MPECFGSPGRKFDSEFFMMINLTRQDPCWLAPKIKLLKQSVYWKDTLFCMEDLNDFADKLKQKPKILGVDYNSEAEKALLLVSSLEKPEGAGNEYKKQLNTKGSSVGTSEFFIPNWKGTSLELLLYIVAKHYCSIDV